MKIFPRPFRLYLGAMLAAVFAFFSIADSQALIVTARNWEIPPNLAVLDSTGNPLPVGSGIVAVGYFPTLSDAQIQGATSVGQLISGFSQFANSSDINGANFGLPGLYAFDADAQINAIVNTDFAGENIYTFIGNALDFVSSTEVLVFKHQTQFQFDGPQPGVDAIMNENQFVLGAQLLVGIFPGDPIDLGLGPTSTFVLQGFGEVIPEPSRVLLSAFGIGFALMRRRRSRK